MAAAWGEIEDPEDDSISRNILTSLQGKFRNGFSNFDLPPLHQPSSSHKGPKKELAKKVIPWLKMPSDSYGQNYLLHSIELQHYKKRMRYVLAAAQSHQLDVLKSGAADSSPLPAPPPPPKRFCASDGFLRSTPQKSFLSSEFDADTQATHILSETRQAVCPIELDSVAARQLMLKSVSAVCAHSGFEYGSDVAISTLTDVFVDHLSKMCKLFKGTVAKQAGGDKSLQTLYVSLEHTCKEFGLINISSLQDYWNNHIRQVAVKLEQESLGLFDEYNLQKESSTEIKRKQIKEEVS